MANLPVKCYDLFIIGGGINGAGIARDAVGRGLSVGLCEQDDLARHTSSASTKLIHGGLRYLEHYDFGLVRKSLLEREVLLQMAPHIIWPLRFVLPHHRGLRPAWMLRAGLRLYDWLGGRSSLPRSGKVRLDRGDLAGHLKPEFRIGFGYSDCWVEDARLVVLNAMDARERGADILTRTRCTGLEQQQNRQERRWRITLQPTAGKPYQVETRLLVNAVGPWVGEIAQAIDRRRRSSPVRLVKGSHIVVRRQCTGDPAWLFQNTDGRVVFAIPYEHDYTLIGTTDVPVDSPDDEVAIGPDEEQYLCRLANNYFRRPVTPDDIVWRYSGVRPLFDDNTTSASKITRDYVLELDTTAAPALSVFGGKLTTYRRLAEDVLTRLRPHAERMGPAWTATTPLPGGDFQPEDFEQRVRDVALRYPFLEQLSSKSTAELAEKPAERAAAESPGKSAARRLFRAYGTRVDMMFQDSTDPGRCLGKGLFEAELRYLVEHEFARTAEDVLWRRSKLGLHLSRQQQERVHDWFRQ